MFTLKGNSKTNWGRQDQSTPEESAAAPAHDQQQQQADELSQEQRAAALDAARFPPPPMPDNTVIGKNFNLEGENIVIRCKGALSINGTVDATIHCEQLTISDSARITGEIAADEVNIHGQVEGTINGAQVILHATADVEADINSQFLSIVRGARFDGRSQRVTDVSQIAPKLMSSANDEENPTSPAVSTPAPTSNAPKPEDAFTPIHEPAAASQPASIEPNNSNGDANGHGEQISLQPTGTSHT